ncbi:MAG: hypothetical protein FWD11_06180 [Micrococcales bacterium]|nr:hypothetical protein [Micrococcales bacterium]
MTTLVSPKVTEESSTAGIRCSAITTSSSMVTFLPGPGLHIDWSSRPISVPVASGVWDAPGEPFAPGVELGPFDPVHPAISSPIVTAAITLRSLVLVDMYIHLQE